MAFDMVTEADLKTAAKQPSLCRIEWSIDRTSGHGRWHLLTEEPDLREWVSSMNAQYGPGSHWIGFQ